MKKIISFLTFTLVLTGIYAQTSGILTIKATTKASLYPHESTGDHLLAIWVEDANGKFVKTLMASSKSMEYRKNLLNWKVSTTLAASAYNVVDAVAGATYYSHIQRTATWNGTNVSKVLVADGNYKVRFEVVDNDLTSYTQSKVPAYTGTFIFAKGRSTVNLTPADEGLLSGISVSWVPDFTGTQTVSEKTLYKIYPNPVSDKLYVPGFGVTELTIFDMSGKLILHSNEPEINVKSLTKGNYIVRISTAQGNYIEKFTKL